ncbi:ECF transporter S component [Clostridium formicaceticum]|uniref:ECF transporter S component n=1 Tax=Clostridium formicaceticum TaxID=1497 RepID=A0AAC9WK26_9CLOT|nr:ECF transporter S component [Clostridium formicaceticum]AOY75155.1 ECF transporter S component [Clostridium formicaceticum]ARE89580.1 Pantothenic acid transporter PanT [Clostridium formicaceticum]
MSICSKELKGSKNRISTKKMAVAGMLGGFSVALSMTPIGYIPIPFLGINATTMHIPVIIGAILGGPMIGTFVGIIFGVSSLLRATTPFFADPLVAILPRLLIGIMSYYTYKLSKNAIVPAVVGTATNTVGVMTMIYLRGYLPLEAVLGIAAINGTAEVVVSSFIVYAVVKAMKNFVKTS